MDKLTYRQAYDKIIEAYFRDEIQPMDPAFCFCGTLAGNVKSWVARAPSLPPLMNHLSIPAFIAKEHSYSQDEYATMEHALLIPLMPFGIAKETIGVYVGEWSGIIDENIPGYEDALFAGMSAALDVLKEIHRSRGEDVDGQFTPFTKRELVKSL